MILETCDLWDIWSQWWGDLTKPRCIFRTFIFSKVRSGSLLSEKIYSRFLYILKKRNIVFRNDKTFGIFPKIHKHLERNRPLIWKSCVGEVHMKRMGSCWNEQISMFWLQMWFPCPLQDWLVKIFRMRRQNSVSSEWKRSIKSWQRWWSPQSQNQNGAKHDDGTKEKEGNILSAFNRFFEAKLNTTFSSGLRGTIWLFGHILVF